MTWRLLGCIALLAAADAQPPLAAAGHFTVTEQIDAPEGAWTFASIDGAGRKMYIGRSSGILAVDLETHRYKTLDTAGKRVQMIIPVPGSNLIVGTEDTTNSAVILDTSTGAVVGQVSTGRRPETAAFDPFTGVVAVMAGSAEVTLIDPKSRTATGTIPVDGILESGVADGKGRLFINMENKHAIAVVDLTSRKMTGSYPLGDCDDPTGLGYDTKLNLLITACGNHVAKAIDAATGADLGTIEIASGPDAVLVDGERRLAFIPCSEGRLAVISLAGSKPVLAESVVTAQGAATGAVDPASGRVYLPVGRAPETDFGGRAVPGFAVLIVERK